ncbi:MAG TPA: hypothetical protein VF653_17985, partial [Methylomirabilota bacterium]
MGIVVSPWVATPVPWYSIAIGMGLARRGRRVTLIHDDTLTAPESPAELLPQHRAICRVTQLLTGHLPTITLTSQAVHALSPADEHEVARLAKLIVIWKTRGALLSASDLAEVESLARSMADTLGRIKALLGSAPFAYLLVGGGIYGSSGLFLWAGQQCGLRVSTFDANLGVVQISTVGLAAQQADIPRAFSEAIRWDSVTKARALQEARHHLDQRVQAKDPAQYQVTASSNASARRIRPPFALVAMNVEHDAAALGRHVTFADTMEWILEVTDFVLEHTSNASVVVRQHPAERKPNEGSQFPIRRVLSERYGSEPRVVFISAAEPVNTYDLVSEAAMVLPYVSTIGIEAAALGKPVLVSGQSCYSDLGFVRTAASRGEYFELLRRGLNADLELLPDQVEKALLCYYLTPVCNRIWTQFTPQPRDFWRWQ